MEYYDPSCSGAISGVLPNRQLGNCHSSTMCEVGVLLGGDEDVARSTAMDIVDLEHKMAAITTPDEDRRHNDNLYQPYSIEKLNMLAPFVSILRNQVLVCWH